MKTKITFKNFATVVIASLLLSSFSTKAQTHVYNESTTSGIFIDGGSQVANPLSDAVNSSATCAQSGTGWQKIEFFPTYTVVTGNKLYFSIYNPNNIASAQIKFDYSSGETEVWGGNVSYTPSSVTGWVEYSLDLSSHVGKQINKIWLYAASGEPKTAYIDNIYFHTSSTLIPPSSVSYVYNDVTTSGIFIDGGSQVANPLSDAVNSSATCAQSGTGWQKMEFFPTYTVVTGNKLYFSVYNPNNIASAQLKFNYSSGETEVWGGNVSYSPSSVTGWVEYSLDLTDHVGKQINKIWLYLASGEAKTAYVDNIYFSTSSVLIPPSSATQVYNDVTTSGIFIDGGSQVANPLSDAVNSSATCAQSGTVWQKMEFFPTYTPVSGNKLYFSVYNPNNIASAQLKFNYSSGETEVWGGNVSYSPSSVTGWVEYSLDLTGHVGKQINKIWLYVASGEAKTAYIDNIYFSTSSTLSTKSFESVKESKAFVSSNGKINFMKEQFNTTLSVYDMTGRLVLNEKINGLQSVKSLSNSGIYILRIETNNGVFSQKIAY